MNKLACWLSGHKWIYGGELRACLRCCRVERRSIIVVRREMWERIEATAKEVVKP